MHMDYELEAQLKRQRVYDVLQRIGGVDPGELPITAAPTDQGYRNKAQFPVAMASDGPCRRILPSKNPPADSGDGLLYSASGGPSDCSGRPCLDGEISHSPLRRGHRTRATCAIFSSGRPWSPESSWPASLPTPRSCPSGSSWWSSSVRPYPGITTVVRERQHPPRQRHSGGYLSHAVRKRLY